MILCNINKFFTYLTLMIKEIQPTKQILEATCDICGADCMIPIYEKSDGDRDEHDIIKNFEGMILNADWGYNSNKDGEVWKACVCEKCVDKHLKPLIEFSIKPY